YEEQIKIEAYKELGYSNRKIARILNRAPLYKRIGNKASSLFKTMTSDNGSEFAGIHELLKHKTAVFFARPYASYGRRTKEYQQKLIHSFIPKGKCLNEISTKTINRIHQWTNNIPRKILGYQIAREAFLKEIQVIAP